MLLNARQNNSVRRKLATLKKHHSLLKKANARLHRKQHQERGKIVVLRLCVVVVCLQARLGELLSNSHAAAAPPPCRGDLYSRK
jgi:hypothetical protein